MPVHMKKIGDKWRILEPSGKIAKTPKGKPRDGGGHSTRGMAASQVRAMNMKR